MINKHSRLSVNHTKMSDISVNDDYENDAYCLSVEETATDFVENLLETAVEEIKKQGVEVEFEKRIRTPQCLVEWPSTSDFTPELGLEKVDEYITTWSRNAEMMYCIDYTGFRRDSRSDFHFYEVKWSVPNTMYPVPPAVASVFFTVELSRIKHPSCPVKVTYVFEGSKLKHTPGDTPFPLKWVWDIIWNKVQIFKKLSF